MKEGFTWGYKDASGGWAIPPKYNDAENFKNGFASVQNGDKWIVIDVHGNPVPQDKKKIHVIGPYSEGLALAGDNGLLGWIDAQEHLAFPLRKYQEAFNFSGGLARFKLDDLYGYLDKSGNIAIMNQYEGAERFRPRSGEGANQGRFCLHQHQGYDRLAGWKTITEMAWLGADRAASHSLRPP